jgi:prenyltransferase beta subunit
VATNFDDRRRVSILTAIGLAVVCGLGVPVAKAQAPAAAPPTTAAILTEARIVERVTAAVDRALGYVAAKQQIDGSWTDNQAVNSLAILSYLGRGNVPGRGPYRDLLARAKKFLLASQQPSGLFVSPRASHGPMYEHALSTLACAEMYGMDPDPELEEKLRRAVDLILKAQSPNGGWRYQPRPGDHDLSVTVMQIVALRAANNAEIPVPEPTIEKAVAYVKSCAARQGGFAYQPGQGPNPQMSAAGVLSLQLLGRFDDPAIRPALEFMAKLPVRWENSGLNYFYYFHYYAIQGHYQAGDKYWNDWHPRVRELLLGKQNSDGSWDVPPGTAEQPGAVGPNKIYWTAMASLVLEIYMHFLPAYQR